MGRNTGNSHRAKTPDFAVKAALRATLEALEKRQAPVSAFADPEPEQPPKPDRKPQREISDEEFAKLAGRLEKRETNRQIEARSRVEVAALNARWSHKQGTPETLERIESVPSRRRQSPLMRMYQNGKISLEELAAAEQIADVIEMRERAVAPKTAMLEARVDCSGAGKDVLVEGLRRIRYEVAFSIWRDKIPVPKRMIMDMIQTNQSYTQQAQKYGLNWRTARKRLLTSLQLWIQLIEETQKNVSVRDVYEIYDKIGGGTLLAPPPKQKSV